MKTKSILHHTYSSATALVAVSLLALCGASQAKNHHKDDDKDKGHHSTKHKKTHHDDDHDRTVYLSHPRSNFILSLGDGYAGRGYYYGPPNATYYYERPEVRYYATREAAPREYYVRESYRSNNSTDAAVQNALARRGYYHGPVDGELGPISSRAIARFQQDRGLRVTGTVSQSLLEALGL